MSECRAALRWSWAAFAISLVALLYATWYLPGLVRVLQKLSHQIEASNANHP
jgi:hypothetical protein